MRQQLPVYSPLSAAAVGAAWRSCLLTGAPRWSTDLEAALSRRYAARSIVLTDSGTSALVLALIAMAAQRPGGMVALPAYSCYNVATAAVGAGANVRLYDLDPATLGPDFDSLGRALDNGVGVVVVAHLYGVPVDMERAAKICQAHGAFLVEDAAQGAQGRLGGRDLGSWGSVSILSFGRGKGTTGGGGGALLSHDTRGERALQDARPRAASRGRWRIAAGMAAQWLLARPAWYRIPASMPFLKLGETVYQDPWEPTGISEASAAALALTLPTADAEVRIRRGNAERLLRSVSASPVVEPVFPPAGAEPGFLRLPVRASEGTRATLLSDRARTLGIMRSYPKALTELEQFRALCANGAERFPGAERLARDLFTLPTHSLLSEGDLTAVEDLVRGAAR